MPACKLVDDTATSECYIVKVLNFTQPVAGQPLTDSVRRAYDSVDRDFASFYDLLEKAPTIRWVPVPG